MEIGGKGMEEEIGGKGMEEEICGKGMEKRIGRKGMELRETPDLKLWKWMAGAKVEEKGWVGEREREGGRDRTYVYAKAGSSLLE